MRTIYRHIQITIQFLIEHSEYRNANESRRIGSGRIPLRDSWDDPKYSRPNASDYPSKSGGDPSSSPTNSANAATTTTTVANKTEQNKTSETSSNGKNSQSK